MSPQVTRDHKVLNKDRELLYLSKHRLLVHVYHLWLKKSQNIKTNLLVKIKVINFYQNFKNLSWTPKKGKYSPHYIPPILSLIRNLPEDTEKSSMMQMIGSENYPGNSGVCPQTISHTYYKNSDFIFCFVNDSIGHPDFGGIWTGFKWKLLLLMIIATSILKWKLFIIRRDLGKKYDSKIMIGFGVSISSF